MTTYNPRFDTDAPTPQKAYDGVAIASLVTGILLVPFAPIVLGFVARGRCRRSGKRGMGVALTAIVMGALGSLFWMASFMAFMTVLEELPA